MSNQSYASPGNPYWLSASGVNSVSFNKLSAPPLAFLDKGILYELDDGKLYFNGGEIPTAVGNVVGPAVSTTNAIATYADTTGDLLLNSSVKIIGDDLSLDTTGAILSGTTNLISNRLNLLVGNSGGGYTGEQNNILLENNGEVGDVGIMRFGTPGIHETTYIAGIDTSYLTYNTCRPVAISTLDGQLGFTDTLDLEKLYINNILCIHRSGDVADWNAFFFAGNELITGGECCGFGNGCMRVHNDGWDTTAMGAYCLYNSVSCENVVAVGSYALYDSVNCTRTTAIGGNCMTSRTTGIDNTCVGWSAGAGSGIPVASGSANTCIGSLAGNTHAGNNNVYLGYLQGRAITGNNNIRINGTMHGFASTGDDNIFIGSVGNTSILTESAAIRLGTQGTQTSCYIAGIYNNITTNAGIGTPYELAVINGDGKMGRVSALDVANRYSIKTISTTPYSILATDEYIISTLSATMASSITLPAASAGTRRIVIIDGGGNSLPNIITINKTGADSINGGAVYLLNLDWIATTFVNDGISKWFAVSNRN